MALPPRRTCCLDIQLHEMQRCAELCCLAPSCALNAVRAPLRLLCLSHAEIHSC